MATPAPSQLLTDEQLAAIVAGRAQSRAAFEEARRACNDLYQRHARLLLAFLSRQLPRTDLEDAAQAIWERVWRRLPEGFAGGNFRAWLFQIARNLLIDLGRKHAAVPSPGLDDLADVRQSVHDWLLARERIDVLRRCVEALDSPMAEVVRGRLRGETYAEICQRTRLDGPRAMKLFHVAKQRLHDCVERDLP
jgi:RNA polymerase sigma factor (sigma-70 family)